MRRQKPLTTQTELDTRLLNYCLLPAEGKRAESSKRVEMNGRSNIFVSVSARKHFPVCLLLSRRVFNLGCYSSEELETNPELQLKKFANKTYLTYQDLVFFAQEIKKLKSEWGNLSRDEVIKYHASLPNKNVVIPIEKVRDIFIRCSKNVLGRKIPPKFFTSKEIDKSQEPPKRPQFVEVKKNEEVKLSEKVLDQEVKFEEEPLSSKEINEQIEDLEVQMKLLNIEKQQIVLQQKINKLKRA